MSERDRERIENLPREGREEIEEIREIEDPELRLGAGGGIGGINAPVLDTDVDSINPDAEPEAEADPTQQAVERNWVAAEELPPGLETAEPEREPLHLTRHTHLVTAFDEDLGDIEEVYGYEPGDPRWAAVKAGDRRVMVPVISGTIDGDSLQVPYPKHLIESAPEYPAQISLAQEMALYSHYNERRMLPSGADSDRTLLQPLNHAA